MKNYDEIVKYNGLIYKIFETEEGSEFFVFDENGHCVDSGKNKFSPNTMKKEIENLRNKH